MVHIHLTHSHILHPHPTLFPQNLTAATVSTFEVSLHDRQYTTENHIVLINLQSTFTAKSQ